MDVTLDTLHEDPLVSSFLTGFSLWNTRDTTVLLQSLEKARTQEEEFDSNLIYFNFCSYWIQLEATPVCLDKWSAYLCNLLLCWPRHGCWGATCQVSESWNLQRWAVLPAILGLVDSTGVSSHGLWIICEPCMTLLEFVNKEDWVGHPWGEANEINQPLPICHNDWLKNKKNTEKIQRKQLYKIIRTLAQGLSHSHL